MGNFVTWFKSVIWELAGTVSPEGSKWELFYHHLLLWVLCWSLFCSLASAALPTMLP